MSEFIKAYRKRIEYVDKYFREIAEDLKKEGCTVYAPNNELIQFIVVEKGSLKCDIEFSDVPYRYSILIDVPKSITHGSHSTVSTIFVDCIEFKPYTANEIISHMATHYNAIDTYLKQL